MAGNSIMEDEYESLKTEVFENIKNLQTIYEIE